MVITQLITGGIEHRIALTITIALITVVLYGDGGGLFNLFSVHSNQDSGIKNTDILDNKSTQKQFLYIFSKLFNLPMNKLRRKRALWY